MIYPTDFNYNFSKSNSDGKKLSNSTVSVLHISPYNRFIPYRHSNNPSRRQVDSPMDGEESTWSRYCNNTTVHGFRYLTDRKIQYSERITWCVVVVLAVLGGIYVSHLLQLKFSATLIATVVETTFFPVFEIPYPAVTVCNYNRINWERVPAAKDFYLRTATNDTVSKFNDIIIGLNALEFGGFDDFQNINNVNITDLDHINLTELYKRVNFKCEELFVEPCWWRNKYYSCCNGSQRLFFMQKSEYGICYAFNSVLNANGRMRRQNESNYPWRTSSFGDWSGLQLKIQLNDSKRIPNMLTSSDKRLISLEKDDVTNPRQIDLSYIKYRSPGSIGSARRKSDVRAHFIPRGTSTAVNIKPAYSYATSEVKRLMPTQRRCLYPDEAHEHSYETLPGTLFFRSNCISECRQRQMIKNCNCTVDIFYPTADYPKCNMSSLKCLHRYNSLFNYERPPKGNPFFSEEEEGLICDCLPECESIDYSYNVSPLKKLSDEVNHAITVDIHFQQSTMVKYRTDVEFDWLDLMVSFGGIAGLFLGCSLISLAEIVFYFVIGMTKWPWGKLTSFYCKKEKFSRKLSV